MRFYRLGQNTLINVEQISSVELNVKGSECGATYDERNDLFVVVFMVDGRKYHINNEWEGLVEFMLLLDAHIR